MAIRKGKVGGEGKECWSLGVGWLGCPGGRGAELTCGDRCAARVQSGTVHPTPYDTR